MSVSKSLEYVLQSQISVGDKEWVFDAPNIPDARILNDNKLTKLVTLVTRDAHHRLLLRVQLSETSRAIRQHPLDKYLLVSFAEFRPLRGSSRSSLDASQARQPSSDKERVDYTIRFLRAGIVINNVHYNFYGHSNSQLKSNTCYFLAQTKEAISRTVESFGDFTHMKSVAQKSKRIGLLFTVAKVAMDVSPNRVQDIPDIKRGNYNFTDGCGLISPHFASELSRRLGVVFRNRRYSPSVWQIRYRGYKGTVTVDPTMTKEYWLKVRNSMKKFGGGEDLSFSVIEHSKPYTFGRLNDETIMLLDALGIDKKVLIRKQQEYLDFLSQAGNDPRVAFQFLSSMNECELAEKLVIDSLESVRSEVIKQAKSEYFIASKKGEPKCRIIILKSRLLFGVCDPWGILKEGQCAVKITMDGDGQPTALKGMRVLVTRNPCLHPGDLQKFETVERPEFAHLVDCIVFPTRGKRPSADLLSGGDLDGDKFWVCWDKDLIPRTEAEPASYPGVEKHVNLVPITDDSRLVYFANYNNMSVAKVKNLHLRWAKVEGAMSPECQQLNRLSSQCLDGYELSPSELAKFENPSRPSNDAPPFILDELHEAYKNAKTSIVNSKNMWPAFQGQDLNGIELLLCRDGVAISEMEFIRLAVKWCRTTSVSFELLAHCFDFNILTAEEKAWVLAQIPPTEPMPSLVLNALCSSDLVTELELRPFYLNYPGMHWKRIFSTYDRPATFLEACTKNLAIFHKKLVLFRPENRLTLAMYIPEKVTPSDDHIVDDRVKLIAFPHSQGSETQSRMSLPTKKNYKLYCDENVLQLFLGSRRDTWVFLQRGPSDDSTRRRRHKTQDSRNATASIALNKFSARLQRHIGGINRTEICAAEIYIISNRDVSSMRVLDLWENWIDSDQILPLFDQTPKRYDVPLVDVNSCIEDELVVQVVKKHNFSALVAISDPSRFKFLIEWLVEKHQRRLVVQCYQHLLEAFREGLVRLDVFKEMLGLLNKVPYVSVEFEKLGPWDELPEEFGRLLEEQGVSLLRAIVFSESQFGELVVVPFERALENITRIRVEDFLHLAEMIAITTRSPDVALDLLLEVLEKHSTRLLSGRPDLMRYFVQNTTAVVAEYLGLRQTYLQIRDELLDIRLSSKKTPGNIGTAIEVGLRIDSDTAPPVNAHVRLVAASPPKGSLLGDVYCMDGLVIESRYGIVKIVCFHPVPPFYQSCSWKLQCHGNFEGPKVKLDALLSIAKLEHKSCGIIDQILARSTESPPAGASRRKRPQADPNLNEGQNVAMRASLNNAVACILTPRWTGTTRTAIAIIHKLQSNTGNRILVAAPNHAILDQMMKAYLLSRSQQDFDQNPMLKPLRFSLDICNVDEDTRQFTCEFLIGEAPLAAKSIQAAKKHMMAARIVFAVCIESGLGLVRDQRFNCVIVIGSSQLTEAECLVPLAKGCKKAVLLGDHRRFRPKVHELGVPFGAHVSLFERLHTKDGIPGVAQAMLKEQYRMHPLVCNFVSREFYNGELSSMVQGRDFSLRDSEFPWPVSSTQPQQLSRVALVECAGWEEIGPESKLNKSQAKVCFEICNLLRTERASRVQSRGLHRQLGPPTIAVLTPYVRQLKWLEEIAVSKAPGIQVATVDEFQDQSADIVIFCTVRCNASREVGSLGDGRLMNVVFSSAKLGLVVVGNRATLMGSDRGNPWARLMGEIPVAQLS